MRARTLAWTLFIAGSLTATLAYTADAYGADASSLLGAERALARLERVEAKAPARSAAAVLLDDVAAYRRDAAGKEAKVAVSEWLALYDRAARIGDALSPGSLEGWDAESGAYVGPPSLFAALPPPEAWPALREALDRRAAKAGDDRNALVLRFIGEVLVGDRKAAAQTVDAIERSLDALEPDDRKLVEARVDALRQTLASLYGTRDDLIAGIVATARRNHPWSQVVVPDLVGLVGEVEARRILADLVTGYATLTVGANDATRELAQEIALAEIDRMKVPQWALVDRPQATALYEALERRFAPKTSLAGDDASADETATPLDFDGSRMVAEQVYFVGLVVAGRRDEAMRLLARITRDSDLDLQKQTLDALVASEQHEALYRFFGDLLEKNPQARVWNVYLERAAYTGHTTEALALLDRLLARKDLPAYLAASLREKRIAALLAADRVDDAVSATRALLRVAPSAEPTTGDEAALVTRAQAALRLATLARLVNRPGDAAAGIDFVRQALALDVLGPEVRPALVLAFYGELRRAGRDALAEQAALAELERERAKATGLDTRDFTGEATPARAALVELVGIYHAAGRSTDVLALLDRARDFGARDLADVVATKDTTGLPIGVAAARALAAQGDRPRALAVASATLDALPGNDAAYEVYVDVAGGDAIAALDRRYLADRFEERPLIWKAVAQNAAGKYDEAEATIKSAIAIDPSDGEQGRDDRMRAYATLAAILEAKDEGEAARVYRRAVAAIRLSEQGDELHAVGLYPRAFAKYREALEQFSDAYCVQSRLAVQLSRQGRQSEALQHYRRAYELMPDSFGRVESHCFGCESVFAGTTAQGIAEEVFAAIVAKSPDKAQGHYMLGYLRKEQGRYTEAVQAFRDAVARDPDYLNAWRQLHEVAEYTWIDPAERDIARLKLLELDPAKRHVKYELSQVSDLRALYRAVDGAAKAAPAVPAATVYPLAASAASVDDREARLGPEIAAQWSIYRDMQVSFTALARTPSATKVLQQHALIKAAAGLLTSAPDGHGYFD